MVVSAGHSKKSLVFSTSINLDHNGQFGVCNYHVQILMPIYTYMLTLAFKCNPHMYSYSSPFTGESGEVISAGVMPLVPTCMLQCFLSHNDLSSLVSWLPVYTCRFKSESLCVEFESVSAR